MVMPKPDASRALLATGLALFWVASSLTVDRPMAPTLPFAGDTAQGVAIAARFGDAAILLSWR